MTFGVIMMLLTFVVAELGGIVQVFNNIEIHLKPGCLAYAMYPVCQNRSRFAVVANKAQMKLYFWP